MTAFPRGGASRLPERATTWRIRPARAKPLSPGQSPWVTGIYVNPLALKEQKKHTLCVSAAPVGRTPENTRHTWRCPGLKSRLGLQPASAQTPPQQLDRPRPHMLNGRRHTKNKPAKVKKRGHIPAPMHTCQNGQRYAVQRIRTVKVKKGHIPAMGRVDGSWYSETLCQGVVTPCGGPPAIQNP